MRKLNDKEIRRFTKKYLSDWIGDIKEVSMLTYRLTREYLVNNHYLVIIKPFKKIELDLID